MCGSDNDRGSQHRDRKDDDAVIYWASDQGRESIGHLAAAKVHTALRSNVYIYFESATANARPPNLVLIVSAFEPLYVSVHAMTCRHMLRTCIYPS